jgi:hypothetical protein
MRKLFFAFLIGGSLIGCTDSSEVVSEDSNDAENPATTFTRKRVIRPLASRAVYIENIDTAFRPHDTIVIQSESGRVYKAVVIR